MADGETLWSIARRYDVTVDAVRAANEMESETIRPGQTLRIPARPRARPRLVRRARSLHQPAFTGSASSARRVQQPPVGHRGERGAASRGAPDSAVLHPRADGLGTPRAVVVGPAGSRPAGAARAREHTVGEGETLWGIARRYETTVDSLRRANDLDADEQIQPGQKLSIPAN